MKKNEMYFSGSEHVMEPKIQLRKIAVRKKEHQNMLHK
ncbi:hypothetical protein GWE_03085 [Chlamydia psittaci NJ1]|nr:hypothetical protein B712_0948 [Chlamydia psittaci NJ1]KPZ36277.1 hypothetical protein GWE_03085 [Chlamydia psittaci NJ1]